MTAPGIFFLAGDNKLKIEANEARGVNIVQGYAPDCCQGQMPGIPAWLFPLQIEEMDQPFCFDGDAREHLRFYFPV